MDKLKILWFNWRCWLNPKMGGAEIFTHEVAKRFVENGTEVTLFTSEFPNCKEDEVIDGIRVIRAGGKYGVYLKAKKYYAQYFKNDNYDIIIDEINTRPFLTPKFVKNCEKIVALIHQLAREFWFYEMPFPISFVGYYYLEKSWLKNYIDIPTITVSESTKKDLASLGFKSLYVVPGGASFKPLPILPEKEKFPAIAYVGRLKKAKRVDHVIEAFKIVKAEIPEAQLWIIGGGYSNKDLRKISFDGVKFFGRVSNERKAELTKKAWMMIHSSIREGFPLSVIEANALGTPYVAYDVAGLRDSVVNEETGLLVESGNTSKMAEGIIKVIKDNELRKKLSENALSYAETFSWDKTATNIMSIIESALINND